MGRTPFGLFFLDEKGYVLVWQARFKLEGLGHEVSNVLPEALLAPESGQIHSKTKAQRAALAKIQCSGKAWFNLKEASEEGDVISQASGVAISSRKASKYLGYLRRHGDIAFARFDVEVKRVSRDARRGVFCLSVERAPDEQEGAVELAVRQPFHQTEIDRLLRWAVDNHSLSVFSRLHLRDSADHLLFLISSFRNPHYGGGGTGGYMKSVPVRVPSSRTGAKDAYLRFSN